jgi:hypothetical protein
MYIGCEPLSATYNRPEQVYQWGGYFVSYPDAPPLGFIRTASSLNHLMQKSARFHALVLAKLAAKDLTQYEEGVRKVLYDKHSKIASFAFLSQFTLASIISGCLEDDAIISGIKNADLEKVIVDNPHVGANIASSFYSRMDMTNLLKEEDTNKLIAKGFFKFLLENYSTTDLQSYFNITEIKTAQTYFAEGFKKTGEMLGINWQVIQSWDEVKKWLSPPLNRTCTFY